MTTIQLVTIQFFAPDDAIIPDTIEEWDASEWPEITDNIRDALEIVAYAIAEKNGLTVTID